MGQQSTSNLKVSQSDLGPTAGAAQSLQGCRAPSPEPWLDKRKIKVSTPMCCCLLVAFIQADIGRASDQKSDCWLLWGWCSTIAGFSHFLIWGFPDIWDQWLPPVLIHFFLWFSTKKNIDLGVPQFMETPSWMSNWGATPKVQLQWVFEGWCDVMRYVFVGIYFCLLVVVAKIAHSKKVKAIESHGEIKVGKRTVSMIS